VKYLGITLLLVVCVPLVVYASPSGLNNIPTADTCSPGVLVLQGYSGSSQGEKTSLFVGAKAGPAKDWEIGLDYQAAPEGATGPLVFQVKKAWWLEDGNLGLAVGVAGVTTDWSEHKPFPYAVLTRKGTGADRYHVGFAPQADAKQWFIGYDHTLPCKTMLRFDLVRNTDADTTMVSAGALVPMDFGAVEGWVTRNDGNDCDSTSLTLKVDYAITMWK
jgi:hypothetical protein